MTWPAQRSVQSRSGPPLQEDTHMSVNKMDPETSGTHRTSRGQDVHIIEWDSSCRALPRLERVLDLSMMALLLGLLSTDLLANDMSAVTLVMDILQQHDTWWTMMTYCVKRRCLISSPAIEPVLQEVKQRLLHHVCHLKRNKKGNDSVYTTLNYTLHQTTEGLSAALNTSNS